MVFDDRSLDNPIKVILPRYNVSLRNVKFRDLDNMKINLSVSTAERNSLSYYDKKNSAELNQKLKLDVNIVNENINVKLDHSFKNINFKNKDINLEKIGDKKVQLEAYYNLKTDSLNIGKLIFSFADIISADLTGNITGVSSSQKVKLQINNAEIDIDNALNVVKKNDLIKLPPVSLADTKIFVENISLLHEVVSGYTEVKGNANFNSAKTAYRRKDIYAVINDLNTGVNLDIILDIKDFKLEKAAINVNAVIDNISANVQGRKYRIKNISANIKPELSKDLQPEKISISSSIGQILDGNINLVADVDLAKLTDYSTESIIKDLITELKVSANDLKPYLIVEQAPKGLSFRLKRS